MDEKVAATRLDTCRQVAEPFTCDWVALFADPERLTALRAALEELTQPDFEGVMASGVETLGLPERGVGVPAVLGIFGEWVVSFDLYEVLRFDFRELPDGRLLSAAPIRAHMADPAMDIELEIGTLWTLKDGLVARLEFFMTVADAEAAARLSSD